MELVTAAGPALEELDNRCDGRICRRLHSRRASDVHEAVEIIIDRVMVQLANLNSRNRLIANPQHLQPRPLCRNVFKTPSYFVIGTQARNRLAAPIEPHELGACHVRLK